MIVQSAPPVPLNAMTLIFTYCCIILYALKMIKYQLQLDEKSICRWLSYITEIFSTEPLDCTTHLAPAPAAV